MLLYINKALIFILETLGNNHFGVFQISEKKKISFSVSKHIFFSLMFLIIFFWKTKKKISQVKATSI
jgi:hypothetical protein